MSDKLHCSDTLNTGLILRGFYSSRGSHEKVSQHGCLLKGSLIAEKTHPRHENLQTKVINIQTKRSDWTCSFDIVSLFFEESKE